MSIKAKAAVIGLGIVLSASALAGSRTFNLTRVVVDPASLAQMKDTTNPDHGFTATGTLVINDDTKETHRTMKLCLAGSCTENNDRYKITGYTNGDGAVLLTDLVNGGSHSMVFVWNYIQLGFLDVLPSHWGIYAGKTVSVRWEEAAAGGNGGATAEYKIDNLRKDKAGCVVGSGYYPCIKGLFTNTTNKTIDQVFITINLYKNNVQVYQTTDRGGNIAAGKSWEFEASTVNHVYDTYEIVEVKIYYNK